MSKIETTKRFSVGNTKVNILALTASSKNKIRLSSDNFVNVVHEVALIGWNVNICVANWKVLSSFILDIF